MTETITERFFDSNGVTIRYIEQGEGPAIVLLHGGLASRAERPWVEQGYFHGPFRQFRLIAMDCRGHGQSGKPHNPAAYGLEMVADIVRLLDHLGLEKAHLMGHSMGAEIALKAAAVHPERVYSAVLAGSGWSDPVIRQLWADIADSLDRGEGVGRVLTQWWARPGDPPATEEQIRAMDERLLGGTDQQAIAAVCRNYADLGELFVSEQEVRGLRVPLLGFTGEHDPELAMLKRMEGVAPDFRLVVLEGVGHGGPEFFRALSEYATAFFGAFGL